MCYYLLDISTVIVTNSLQRSGGFVLVFWKVNHSQF